MPQELIKIVDVISGLGFTGLMVVLAIPRLKKFVFGNGNGQIKDLKENHLHSIAESLERIEKKLEKLEEINEGIVWLKAKQNGN